MMSEFKVGDKVTCLINGNGFVKKICLGWDYPVHVEFEGIGVVPYTLDGFIFKQNNKKSLYLGHGTFNIEFIEDKEPEYEWQWLIKSIAGVFETSGCYKNEESLLEKTHPSWVVVKRIEESKREVK